MFAKIVHQRPDRILLHLFSYFLRLTVTCGAIVALTACSVGDPTALVNDPHETANRRVHAFNKGLDRSVLRPAGQMAAATPDAFTVPISNFADNAGMPSAVANGLLQGNIGGAATNTMRFVVNSTVGVGGLFDPASAIGLQEDDTDFGETLAVWGVGEGAYIELPVFGPSTQRDAIGTLVDLVFDPLDSTGHDIQQDYSTITSGLGLAVTRGQFMDTFDGLLYESADSYSQARLAYLQNRRFELGEATPADQEIDPFADDLSLEGFE